jgi:hypothetical protein
MPPRRCARDSDPICAEVGSPRNAHHARMFSKLLLNKALSMSRIPTDDLSQENDNQEQRDGDQAQDVADDAMFVSTDLSEDSEHGGKPNPAAVMPDDTPDLVDTMNQMVSSGRIDNGAFAGEPMHDDEEDRLGQTDRDDED